MSKARGRNQTRYRPVTVQAIITLMLTVFAVAVLASACSTSPAGPPTPTSSPTITPTTPPTETPDPAGTATPSGSMPGQIQAVEEAVQAVASRTPVPTATPGPLEREIARVVAETGLAEQTLLGFSPDVWINLLVMIIIFIIGYVLVVVLLFRFLAWVVKRTKTQFDDAFLASIGRELRWLVLIIIGRGVVLRLDFWRDPQILFLEDLFFFLLIGVLLIIAMRLIRFGGDWVLQYRVSAEDQGRITPFIQLFKRLGYLLTILIVASVSLDHLGVNISWIAGFIILVGVILAFGAREAMGDLISGMLILMDPPYRVGDDIYIPEIDTWGQVLEIGLRHTTLRTLDSRTVIVPNMQIGKNQIINYSYPNPFYRIHTDISLAYESDMALIRQVITEAVQGVEDVVLHKPVNVYFLEFTEAGRAVRVMWWVESVNDMWRMRDRVNSALEEALEAAGIVIAYTTINIKLQGPDDQHLSLPKELRRKNGGLE